MTPHERLTAVLLQGGMPRLFLPNALEVFDQLVGDAIGQPKPQVLPERVPDRPHFLVRLSDMQKAWLQSVADGIPSKEMEAMFRVKSSTIRSHARITLEKLNARNQAHAVAIGLRIRDIT